VCAFKAALARNVQKHGPEAALRKFYRTNFCILCFGDGKKFNEIVVLYKARYKFEMIVCDQQPKK